MEYELIDNKEPKQYELLVEGPKPRIEYILAKDNIYLTHTEVPKALEGQGIASKMVLMALKDIQSRNLTLIPMCPFVAMYIKRHPEWRELVLKGIHIS
ncbi:MAG: GNAT family N-acetyltransferase [Pricia sp.]